MDKQVIRITEKTLRTSDHDPKYPGDFSAVRVVSADDLDLSRGNGYSLGKRWLRTGDFVAVNPDELIVYKLNTGSNRSPEYGYYAVRVNEDGETESIGQDEIDAAVEALTDPQQKVNALNSDAYALAVYIAAQIQPEDKAPTNPLAGFTDEEILIEARKRGLI